jgi:hypothetical protein
MSQPVVAQRYAVRAAKRDSSNALDAMHDYWAQNSMQAMTNAAQTHLTLYSLQSFTD